MSGSDFRHVALLTLTGILTTAGCSAETPASKPTSEASAVDEQVAALAKLAPDDRRAAERQVLCPVSSHALGSMGPPLKVAGPDGQQVFLCCESCKEDFDKNPQVFLAKLKK